MVSNNFLNPDVSSFLRNDGHFYFPRPAFTTENLNETLHSSPFIDVGEIAKGKDNLYFGLGRAVGETTMIKRLRSMLSSQPPSPPVTSHQNLKQSGAGIIHPDKKFLSSADCQVTAEITKVFLGADKALLKYVHNLSEMWKIGGQSHCATAYVVMDDESLALAKASSFIHEGAEISYYDFIKRHTGCRIVHVDEVYGMFDGIAGKEKIASDIHFIADFMRNARNEKGTPLFSLAQQSDLLKLLMVVRKDGAEVQMAMDLDLQQKFSEDFELGSVNDFKTVSSHPRYPVYYTPAQGDTCLVGEQQADNLGTVDYASVKDRIGRDYEFILATDDPVPKENIINGIHTVRNILEQHVKPLVTANGACLLRPEYNDAERLLSLRKALTGNLLGEFHFHNRREADRVMEKLIQELGAEKALKKLRTHADALGIVSRDQAGCWQKQVEWECERRAVPVCKDL